MGRAAGHVPESSKGVVGAWENATPFEDSGTCHTALAVQDFIVEMRSRGHAESKIRNVVYDNPLRFFAQCPRFSFTPRDAEAEVNA